MKKLLLLALAVAALSCNKHEPQPDPTKYYDLQLSVTCERYPVEVAYHFGKSTMPDSTSIFDTVYHHLDTTLSHIRGGQIATILTDRYYISKGDDSSLITMHLSYDALHYTESPIPTPKSYQVSLDLPE